MAELSPALDELLAAEGVPLRPGDPGTVEPRCEHFGTCGGCQLQHLPYPDQLAWKTARVARCFAATGLGSATVHPTLGAADPWAYRNKVDLTAKTYDRELHLGFLPWGEKHTLVEMEHCPIADPAINAALPALRRALPRHPELRKKLISIVCRASRSRGQVGLVYHSKLRSPGAYTDLTNDVMGESESVVGGVYVERRREHVTGTGTLDETVLGRELRFPLRSFFQNNIPQTEALVTLVTRLLAPGEGDVLLDLYAGVGLFGLLLADRVREVYLLEDTPYSVEAARENARTLGIRNVTLFRGQAQERVELMRRSGQHPSCVVLDPPRSGCHPDVLEALAAFPTRPRLAYVSCNPETHARDCARLVELGFSLGGVWPVDLFPQTLHVEAVAQLA